jgi:hypothetical protein
MITKDPSKNDHESSVNKNRKKDLGVGSTAGHVAIGIIGV